MKSTLIWVCRVVRRSKLSKVHVFESLPKPLKVSGNIENRKRYLFYIFKKLKRFVMCKVTKMNVLENLPKPLKLSKNNESRKLSILHFQKNECNSPKGI